MNRQHWAVLGWLLALLAAGYLGYVVWAQRETVSAGMASIAPIWLVVAVLAFTAMTVSKAAYHLLLVENLHEPASRYPRAVASSFLVGQLLRYLPGKVWGLVYQAGRLHDVCPAVVVLMANGIQMAMGILVTITFVFIMLALYADIVMGWLALPITALLVIVAHRHAALLGQWLARISRYSAPLPAQGSKPMRFALLGIVLLALDWLFFIVGFLALGSGAMALADAIPLAVSYAGASVLAMAAVAVPAGLGVREALFVLTADFSGQTAGELLVFGIMARVAMTAADALLAIAALGLLRPEHTDV